MSRGSAFRRAETLMGMSPETWARHANPWSGWSRATILPLLALAVWSRAWIGWWALLPIVATLVWTWLNPRLFPEPASTENWMSRGVLGEQVWLAHGADPALAHHRPVVRTLTVLGFLGALAMAAGLVWLEPTLTVAGMLTAMLSKFWLLDRMVWVYRDFGERLPSSESSRVSVAAETGTPR